MLHLEDERKAQLFEITGTEGTEVEQALKVILEEYDDMVSRGAHDIGNCQTIEHAIKLMDETPVVGKQGHRSPREHEWIEEQVQIMLQNRVIEELSSPYTFNVVVVGKKDGAGEEMDRLCINYAPLNKRTIPDRYPLPNINEMLSSFWGLKWFTVIDLASAYWQIQLRKKDRPKTAFLTRNGQYQFKVMPFRLNNALVTFQRFMNKVLKQYIGKFVQVYLDNVIIYSNNLTEHKKHIKAVLEKIREANLKLKPSKCQWFQTELKFVGHLVGRNGIKPDPQNVEKIKNAEVSKNTTELRRFLGMAQYYRQYINGYADVARPLYDMLKESGPAIWGQAQQEAFDIIKVKLATEPIRAHPDFNKSFKLYTDASDTGLGAVLAQDDEEGKERVIAYEARRLSAPERNYLTTEKECLAVVWAIQKFKQYLGR